MGKEGSRTSRKRADPTLLPQDGTSCSQVGRYGAGICPRRGQRPEGRRDPGRLGRDACAVGKFCCDSGGQGSRVLEEQRPLPAADWPFHRKGEILKVNCQERKETNPSFKY